MVKRKPRYHSEPLPAREDSASPDESEERRELREQGHRDSQQTSRPSPPQPMASSPDIVDDDFRRKHWDSDNRPSPNYRKQAAQPPGTDKMGRDYYAHPNSYSHSPEASSTSNHQAVSASHNTSSPSSSSIMPHRLDSYPARQRYYDEVPRSQYHTTRPSPPPIATIPHSPSLSSDRSSVSSTAPTVLPSLFHPQQALPSPTSLQGSYKPIQQSHIPSHFYGQENISTPELYSPISPPYMSHQSQLMGSVHGHGQPRYHSGSVSMPYPAQTTYSHQPSQPLIYTDDASTKLNDRIRRRCFNCCTTDTSTWRRSSLHPGKVLCNKCGLFERTHSRPRPDQFPHQRGRIVTGGFRTEAPSPMQLPAAHSPTQQDSNRGYASAPGAPQGQTPPPPHGVPPHAAHPSLGPMYAQQRDTSLPQIQDWLRGPGGTGTRPSEPPARQNQNPPPPAAQSGSYDDWSHPSPPAKQYASPAEIAPRTLTPSPSPPRELSPRTSASAHSPHN